MEEINYQHEVISKNVLQILHDHFKNLCEFYTPCGTIAWIPRQVGAWYIKRRLIDKFNINLNYGILNAHLKKMVKENKIDFIQRKSTNTYSLKEIPGYSTRGHFFERLVSQPIYDHQD